MNTNARFIEQPAYNGRPAEFALLVEGGNRLAEGEWFRDKSLAAQDMVEFLEAALVVAKAEVGK
jgi:hypothetical protein